MKNWGTERGEEERARVDDLLSDWVAELRELAPEERAKRAKDLIESLAREIDWNQRRLHIQENLINGDIGLILRNYADRIENRADACREIALWWESDYEVSLRDWLEIKGFEKKSYDVTIYDLIV